MLQKILVLIYGYQSSVKQYPLSEINYSVKRNPMVRQLRETYISGRFIGEFVFSSMSDVLRKLPISRTSFETNSLGFRTSERKSIMAEVTQHR